MHMERQHWKAEVEGIMFMLRTMFMIRLAETLTGTPSSVSWIINPAPTSLTDKASNVYFNGQSH